MAKLTLLQEKNRPIHRLKSTGQAVARTWCGADPYRKGVATEGVNSPSRQATCKACLREERKARTQ